ncbi:MAG: SurA N-terminal domain-containing protein [Candidatus Omnitrophota bacterium]|nr:SurA N-terminal domain-containing protein [Candidatus Omnitrophota bacterium]
MKKYIFSVVIVVIFAFWGNNSNDVSAQEVNRVLARVNNEVITSKDFQEYLEILSYRLSDADKAEFKNDDNFKEQALARMIEDKLILDKAKKDKMRIPSPVIEDKFDKIVSAYSSLEEFEKSLVDKGLNITSLKEKIRDQYISRQIVEIYVKSRIYIEPKEISQYYQKHLDVFSLPSRYAICIAKFKDHDFIKEIARVIDSEGIEKAKDKYADSLVRVESGKEEMREEVSTVLSEIQKGDYFIREIDGLFYLVFLEDELASEVIPLESVKEKIYAIIWDQKMRSSFLDWMNKLKEKALVKVYE